MSLNRLARDSSAAAHQLYIVGKFVFKAEKAAKRTLCRLQRVFMKRRRFGTPLESFFWCDVRSRAVIYWFNIRILPHKPFNLNFESQFTCKQSLDYNLKFSKAVWPRGFPVGLSHLESDLIGAAEVKVRVAGAPDASTRHPASWCESIPRPFSDRSWWSHALPPRWVLLSALVLKGICCFLRAHICGSFSIQEERSAEPSAAASKYLA